MGKPGLTLDLAQHVKAALVIQVFATMTDDLAISKFEEN